MADKLANEAARAEGLMINSHPTSGEEISKLSKAKKTAILTEIRRNSTNEGKENCNT
jgi:hypothetical protein